MIAAAAVLLAGAAMDPARAQASAPAGPPLVSPLFSDGAVIQRDRPIVVWGWAKPRTGVVVTLGGEEQKVRADKNGKWRITLAARPAGGPHRLYVTTSDGRDHAVDNLMIGDVWLCSGQSNMEFPLRQATNAGMLEAGAGDSQLRLFTVNKAFGDTPRDQLEGKPAWAVSSPAAARDFSAVCLTMGQELRRTQKVPIGLVHSSWGGSNIETWMSAAALERAGGFREGLGALRLHATQPIRAEEAFQLQLDSWWTKKAGGIENAAFDFDDSAWGTTDASTRWEDWGDPALVNFDGVMWYRTAVELSPEQAESAAILSMGAADDLDETFVNGERVGGGRGWNVERSYRLREGLLVPGRNVIAVRVLDTGGGGGMYGDADKRALTFADGSVLPVAGPWRYQAGLPSWQIGPAPAQPWGSTDGLTTIGNAMIAPLDGFKFKGFAWYQGESNVADPAAYNRLLPALIVDWRQRFGGPSFLVVQLAGYGPRSGTPVNSAWAHLREVQRTVTAADRNAALATAIDLGDPADIHPTQKLEVGRRLALAARRIAYGEGVNTGPVPIAAQQQGGQVTVTIDTPDPRLVAYGGASALGFELCEASGNCRFADGAVDGRRVLLKADGQTVTRVRYLWADAPTVNLYDASNLPLVPFQLPVEQLAPPPPPVLTVDVPASTPPADLPGEAPASAPADAPVDGPLPAADGGAGGL